MSVKIVATHHHARGSSVRKLVRKGTSGSHSEEGIGERAVVAGWDEDPRQRLVDRLVESSSPTDVWRTGA